MAERRREGRSDTICPSSELTYRGGHILDRMSKDRPSHAEAGGSASLERLQRVSSEWAATIDSLVDLVLLIDSRRQVVRANRTLERWGLGSILDVAGRDLHDLIHPSCSEKSCYLLEFWDRVESSSDAYKLIDFQGYDPSLRRRVSLSVQRVVFEGDQSIGEDLVTVVLRDVSDEYADTLLDTRRGELQALTGVVRGLAHELGNPLAAMKTSIQVLIRNFSTFSEEKRRDYLRRMLDGTNRLQGIIDRVLREKSWEAHRREPIRVSDLLRRMSELFSDEMQKRQIQFSIRQQDPELFLQADRTAVDEVLVNVLKNAIEASQPGSPIVVDCLAEGNQIRLCIKDRGRGIDARSLERIFQPFFTTKSRGSGLGLALANRLMEEMGGRIEVESEEGVGTLVALRFRRSG